MSQALAAATQCRTGVPFFQRDGRLSSTGLRLETFLRQVGCTLYPPQPVALEHGVIPSALPSLRQVYNSEIVQCFPGRAEGRQGDRFPARAARRCLAQGYLLDEIRLVDPEVILVLGRQATHHFLKHVGAAAEKHIGVSDGLQRIQAGGAPLWWQVAGRRRMLIPLVHPSGMTAGRFERMVSSNQPLQQVIQRAVSDTCDGVGRTEPDGPANRPV